MFDSTSDSTLERIEENPTREITDDDMTVMLDALDVDQEATAKRVLFSRKLHYLLAHLVKESARLVVRQNVEGSGFETWRRLYNRFALPDAGGAPPPHPPPRREAAPPLDPPLFLSPARMQSTTSSNVEFLQNSNTTTMSNKNSTTTTHYHYYYDHYHHHYHCHYHYHYNYH